MTFHKTLPRIHIHPVLIVFMIIAFLTGTFMELSIILFIVFVHELGHFFMAKKYRWRVRSVTLWVFGGVMDTDEHGSRPNREEFFVTIAGPLQHLWIYLMLFFLFPFFQVPASVAHTVFYYNTVILMFNLMPIWPLDGGKLLFNVLSAVLPFKKAYYRTLLISMVSSFILIIMVLFVLPFNLSAFLVIAFLLYENKADWNKRFYVFIRFLLSRYEGNVVFSSLVPITVNFDRSFMDVFSQFYREKNHPIYIIAPNGAKTMVDEQVCLDYYFRNRQNKKIGDVLLEH